MTRRRKILFIDRDGTIICEPPDEQIDCFEKLRFVDGVIPALVRLLDHGYELVMVSNQDGLGTASFPRESFEGPHRLMLQVLNSQGVHFFAEHIDASFPADSSPNRKPGLGMVLEYLKSGELDMSQSCVIGDRESDMQLASGMGIAGFRVGEGHWSWRELAERMIDRPRVATVARTTRETSIETTVNLDSRPVTTEIETGIGFFDHMLEQLAVHGGFSLVVRCTGDLHIDAHHTIEDTALVIGRALDEALGDRRGIGRYGFLLAMDESQASVAIDLSGRPAHVQRGKFTTDRIGEFPAEMVAHFFQSLSQTLRAAIHVEFRGENNHHMCEAIFKGVGRALQAAVCRTGQSTTPSTKGVL